MFERPNLRLYLLNIYFLNTSYNIIPWSFLPFASFTIKFWMFTSVSTKQIRPGDYLEKKTKAKWHWFFCAYHIIILNTSDQVWTQLHQKRKTSNAWKTEIFWFYILNDQVGCFRMMNDVDAMKYHCTCPYFL